MSSANASTDKPIPYCWQDFEYLRRIANEHTGIVVADDKYEMYYARLAKRVRHLGLSSFSDYVSYLRANTDTEFTHFINAITTNLTSFFRERHHFDYLKNTIVPELINRGGQRSLRIWSAGCSTGEEPYSIAITLLESVGLRCEVGLEIIATDIDSAVLETARQGVYPLERINNLSAEQKKRWFLKGKGRNEGLVRLQPQAQSIVRFEALNLNHRWHFDSPFDAIFCRNVVIYFDRDTKAQLLDSFANQLSPRGHLFMGHSESLHGLTERFERAGQTVYRKMG